MPTKAEEMQPQVLSINRIDHHRCEQASKQKVSQLTSDWNAQARQSMSEGMHACMLMQELTEQLVLARPSAWPPLHAGVPAPLLGVDAPALPHAWPAHQCDDLCSPRPAHSRLNVS